MSEDTVLTSVGIDVGTTTTQLVISRLTLANVMPGSQVPKIEICHKSISYIGNVHFTPFVDREHVDGKALREIIAKEYAKAGVSPAAIDTGAIIITGETAKKENASEIIHSLAEYAGDFVVATAGPDLESIIAGKGSGAEELSKKQHSRLANIDIGGGTTNIVFIESGRCIGTACVNVGGRLFEVDTLTHRVKYIAPPARKVVDHLIQQGQLKRQDTAEEEEAKMVAKSLEVMVRTVDRVIFSEELDELDKELVMTNSLPKLSLDGVVFSGGVAKYIYQPGQKEWWIHGDVGPLLAEAFRRSRTFKDVEVLKGSETIHATVLGAGAHTVNVSGSTITVSKDALPLRNVPAVYPQVVESGEIPTFSWCKAAENFTDSIYRTVALVVPHLPDTSFTAITNLAENLAEELPKIKGTPKVIIAQQDVAKVLGQTLQRMMGPIPLVCLDGIELHMGDYIDIAKPLPHQDAVPVIVKTLVFAQ